MKAFQITWSEGNPTVVLAMDFDDALETFVNSIIAEDRELSDEQIRSWIDAVVSIGDGVFVSPRVALDK